MGKDDDGMNGGPRNKGQFRKGQSGNPRGRPRKMIRGGQALEDALEVLKAGEQRVLVTEGGRRKKMKAHGVMVHALVKDALTTKDRDATKLFLRLQEAAARTVSAHKREAQDKLGQYIKLWQEGRAPRLRQVEADFLQSVADEIGYEITIKAYEPNRRAEPVTEADLTAIATPQLKRALGVRFETMGDVEFRQVVTRILQAERKRRAEREAVEPVWADAPLPKSK